MRIWSIHPQYLDSKGLVALWREGLLAQNVLLGKTKGYKNHPQLIRFKQHPSPIQALSNYLHLICDEADNRGYHFDRSKIDSNKIQLKQIDVTSGQLDYEWQHFLDKIKTRDTDRYHNLVNTQEIAPHPFFHRIKGDIEAWERL